MSYPRLSRMMNARLTTSSLEEELVEFAKALEGELATKDAELDVLRQIFGTAVVELQKLGCRALPLPTLAPQGAEYYPLKRGFPYEHSTPI